MELDTLLAGLRAISPEHRVRTLYEAVPWADRDRFNRKILDPSVKPIRPDMAVCGPAYTVADSFMSFEMLDDVSKKGGVMVVQSSGAQGSFIGDFMRELAVRDGVTGIVTDGYVTHGAALLRKDLPIFAKGARVQYAGYKMKGTVQTPIVCGGVTVNPGDIIIGNLDGVMVFTPSEAEDLLAKSQWFERITRSIIEKYMDKGMRYTEVPGVRDYWLHKSSGSKNEDEFYREWCEKYGG